MLVSLLVVCLKEIYHMRDVYSEQEEIKGIKVLLTNFCTTWRALSELSHPSLSLLQVGDYHARSSTTAPLLRCLKL